MARICFHFVLGVVCFLVACEFVLRLLPVSTASQSGYYLNPLILSYPRDHSWTVSTGWDLRNAQHLHSNNAGFVAHRDFQPDSHAVALIGDSFVEASMLDDHDRPGQQLERAIGGRPVFTMGAPGSSLLDYAERIRFAQEQYGVRTFVLLMERSDARQSLCGSGNVHGPCLDPQTLAPQTVTLPPPGLAKRVFRHSALAQYVFGQLKFDPQRIWRQAIKQSRPAISTETGDRNASATRPPLVEPTAPLDVVLSTFLSRVAGRVDTLVIILDSDRAAIYRGTPIDDVTRAHFIYKARAAGIIVIDTEPIFRAHMEQSPLKLDVGPYDGHLNALGINLTMRAAAAALHNQ